MDAAVKSVLERLLRSDAARFHPRLVQWVKAKEDNGFDPPDIAARLRELEKYEEEHGPTHDFWGWLENGDKSGKMIAKLRTSRLQNEAAKFKNGDLTKAGDVLAQIAAAGGRQRG